MTTESSDTLLLAWEARQPAALTGDPLWKLNCYREALFLADHVRGDIKGFGLLVEDGRGKEQLRNSVGSIAAISERDTVGRQRRIE